jgi:glycosyltransferase involved in cell wall biosynthesis
MEYIIQILAGVAAFTALTGLIGTLINAKTAPRLHQQGPPSSHPRVSLLIPARNEAHNLETLLPGLLSQDYENLEIILLDDRSEDGTGDLARHSGVRVIEGKSLPPGWLGKPWACAQLAEAAGSSEINGFPQGKDAVIAEEGILIFCDADARLNPSAVSHTVSFLLNQKADCVTAMPRSLLGTWSEKAVIPPLLHSALLGFLPIAWIPRRPEPLLSAANGQWLGFTQKAYTALGGHHAVRDRIIEDMAFARLVKAKGFRLAVALAPNDLAVRMYRSFSEVLEGFGKNLFFLSGASWVRFFAFINFYIVTQILPLLMPLLGFFEFIPALTFIVIQRYLGAWIMREPWDAWCWHPIGLLLIPFIAAKSVLGRARGSLQWKGRLLPSDGPSEDFFGIPQVSLANDSEANHSLLPNSTDPLLDPSNPIHDEIKLSPKLPGGNP